MHLETVNFAYKVPDPTVLDLPVASRVLEIKAFVCEVLPVYVCWFQGADCHIGGIPQLVCCLMCSILPSRCSLTYTLGQCVYIRVTGIIKPSVITCQPWHSIGCNSKTYNLTPRASETSSLYLYCTILTLRGRLLPGHCGPLFHNYGKEAIFSLGSVNSLLWTTGKQLWADGQ